MLEELIVQIKCIYIYTIIGVLEAGDHYVKIPFTTIIADFEISKSCYGLLICRSQYIRSQLTWSV